MAEREALAGMGAIITDGGVAFRVWAPHADSVAVTGDFNEWSITADPLGDEGNGFWYGFVEGATAGQEYKFHLTNGEQELDRIDPYAMQVTNSVGNGVIYDHAAYDWEGETAHCPPHHQMVIYEMHVGSFAPSDDGVGGFHDVIEQLDYLQELGVNTLQIMPVAEFAGDQSWGYNPAHIFAVESAYGGPDAFKTLIKTAHSRGFAVILDVVYNHFGPSDLDLWQFDGWVENGKGGIYFYNDDRSSTPWGDTRPDYGREEVRRFIHDNAMMWLREYHVDGLRLDMTPYMRSVHGGGFELEEGFGLMRWITDSLRSQYPGRISIAEDLHGHDRIVGTEDHGAGFHAQWDAEFVHPVRHAITAMTDEERSLSSIAEAISHNYDGDPFRRVVYTESHDEVANGSARVPHEIDPENADGWFAQKRSTVGGALVMTSPGIPMIFQGQEALEGGWFSDDDPLDWDRIKRFEGITKLYKTLIDLRLNRGGVTRGLTGRGLNVYHVNEEDNVIVFQRWMDHGAGDDVVVVVNLSTNTYTDYRIGMPHGGLWKLRFNSDAKLYSSLFGDHDSFDVTAFEEDEDGMGAHSNISVGPYSVLIYSQDA
ncbi:alpha amylase C-terminal domain-containing protein [Tessaracoccus sp. MC1627]|uniref:alpha-amylase family glycosyl hydrolase n=1 Tax=Tessaracoccus sp. MC1627 TaxID=2760312 RepID=UPI0016049BA7|nr:alpha-amylase family glycosyl hydrolase [Tessaracoccus sp. MC1627]MBB1511046.1 alpha amylase C-terminal domain-containing protein [Tessaracoccus sp. MC1627]